MSAEQDVSAGLAALEEEFAEAILDACDIPEELRELWRDLR